MANFITSIFLLHTGLPTPLKLTNMVSTVQGISEGFFKAHLSFDSLSESYADSSDYNYKGLYNECDDIMYGNTFLMKYCCGFSEQPMCDFPPKPLVKNLVVCALVAAVV